jgi:hypothetical protein
VEEGLKISLAGDRDDLHNQITPSSLPTVRKPSRIRSMWASVWVAM